MKNQYEKLKREIFDLFGEISLEELMSNYALTALIDDFSMLFRNVSVSCDYKG